MNLVTQYGLSVFDAFAVKIQKEGLIIKWFLHKFAYFRFTASLDFRSPSGTKEGMMRRAGSRVRLGFQWDAGSWERVPAWCDYLAGVLGLRQVCWNIPALPPDMPPRRRASVVRALRSRIESSGDALASRGFAGACHPVLAVDELDRELAWGLKNQWGTGITDVFGVRPGLLIPSVADVVRPAAWKAYARHGFRGIGIFGAPASLDGQHAVAGCTRYPVAAGPGWPGERQLRKLIGSGASGLFLILDLGNVTDDALLRQVMEGAVAPLLGAGSGLGLHPLDDNASLPDSPPPGLRADWEGYPAPVLHEKLESAAAVSRRKRKRSEEYAEVLSRLGPAAVRPPEATSPREDSHSLRLVAHMLGDVTLAGPKFDVRLTGGRFCGITCQGTDLLPRIPAESYLRADSRASAFRTRSSFSFEGENGTGLREELGIDGRTDALLHVEYTFQDDSPHLTISSEMRFPQFGPGTVINEYAPLAIALCPLGRSDSATVGIESPDGEAASVIVKESDGWVFLPGASHRVALPSGGWIRLEHGSPRTRTWGLPFFRIVRTHAGRVLQANPFGSAMPVPLSAVSGRTIRRTLHLGLENA
jgi:hypothetical protein